MYKIKIKINKMAIAEIIQLLNHSQTRKCLHVILIHLFEMSNWKVLNIFRFRKQHLQIQFSLNSLN